MLANLHAQRLIRLALDEDIGDGDLTTGSFKAFEREGEFKYMAKEPFRLCGTEFAKTVFEIMDASIVTDFLYKDGDEIEEGEIFGYVRGPINSILTAERTSLNILQRLSGISTNARNYVKALDDSNIRILDTRKTTPGWRVLEKYAVKVGGAFNHRMGLFDGVMLKDNHVDAAGSITDAVAIVKEKIPITVKVEVEVRNLEEVAEAAAAGTDIIMLDNFDLKDIPKAIEIIDKRCKIEVSGGINMDNLMQYKGYKIDYISIGALTHQAKNVDISLKLVE